LYDKSENLETVMLDAPHNYNKANREHVYRFFAKHILHPPDAAASPRRMLKFPTADMLSLFGRALPTDA